MNIETVDELADAIADMLGVYGTCPGAEKGDDCHNENITCCRMGFVMVMTERIRNAVYNEAKLYKAGL